MQSLLKNLYKMYDNLMLKFRCFMIKFDVQKKSYSTYKIQHDFVEDSKPPLKLYSGNFAADYRRLKTNAPKTKLRLECQAPLRWNFNLLRFFPSACPLTNKGGFGRIAPRKERLSARLHGGHSAL